MLKMAPSFLSYPFQDWSASKLSFCQDLNFVQKCAKVKSQAMNWICSRD